MTASTQPGKATACWHYSSEPYDDWGTIRNADGHVVATTRYPYATDDEKADHRLAKTDPYAETAHLIAAAPDLRDALETLEKYAIWQINEGNSHHPTLPSAVSKARAALRKANGGRE